MERGLSTLQLFLSPVFYSGGSCVASILTVAIPGSAESAVLVWCELEANSLDTKGDAGMLRCLN